MLWSQIYSQALSSILSLLPNLCSLVLSSLSVSLRGGSGRWAAYQKPPEAAACDYVISGIVITRLSRCLPIRPRLLWLPSSVISVCQSRHVSVQRTRQKDSEIRRSRPLSLVQQQRSCYSTVTALLHRWNETFNVSCTTCLFGNIMTRVCPYISIKWGNN